MQKYFPWLLIICGALGLLSAGILTYEKLEIIKNPDHVAACNINPIIACGSVISTDQASAFGVPNPWFGLIGFTAVMVVGISLLAGMQITKRWYWLSFWAGSVFGVGFVHWLIFQSIYRIEALCPFCMVVWVITLAIFWYTTLWLIREGTIRLPKGWSKANQIAQRNHLGILISWYLVIFAFVLNHFWYYFGF